MAAHTSFPTVRPSRREPEDHSLRSAVAVVAAGLVLVMLLVGGGAVVASLLDLMSWVSPS
ncbi:hypothetical protein Cfla_2725 [Cellulomonas flavigena DSM 20109]|uniref:Uncharacterized protein n=1 Tax=Cellulomonas flavigena (strain ATCC 482 / DSM 20109 / BCRC 11376 / JCM 18109 / NBRC 3775 / NCIMB 8073 / NRS 134) TaxID=446466 RepID=D5UJH3_CELFN|nr:hypothetical protein [Cellulomonas flavigena]ADG75611.1 hypothetical protein Cfla_2725 [Cellulomonas flavigena DSM 20109]